MTEIQSPYGPLAFFLDLEPALADFRSDVVAGLSKPQKSLSPMYFYDARGSALFERITELGAYYPTRTERRIMEDNAAAIAAAVGERAAVLEYGSGSSAKIRKLLSMLNNPLAYVAMDISCDHLLEGMTRLAEETAPFPVGAICADFNDPVALPRNALPAPDKWLGYFPGSTLGNFTPEAATAFLTRASETLGDGALFLLGNDLYKDEATLVRAYDDPEGVTAAFNLNLLTRMKRELGADLRLDDFEHLALFNADASRIEMHLRARRETEISLGEATFVFAAGETLHTENSYKYSLERLEALIAETPWRLRETWTDEREWFATCLLSNN